MHRSPSGSRACCSRFGDEAKKHSKNWVAEKLFCEKNGEAGEVLNLRARGKALESYLLGYDALRLYDRRSSCLCSESGSHLQENARAWRYSFHKLSGFRRIVNRRAEKRRYGSDAGHQATVWKQ